MGRREKGRALARYLLGHSGIPFISWDGVGITSPNPYQFDVTTSRNIRNWSQKINVPYEGGKIRAVIRYDADIGGGVESAWVAMDLKTFVELLKAHYDHVVEPRVRDGE